MNPFRRSPRRQRTVAEVRSPRHPAVRLEQQAAAEEAREIMNRPPPDPTPSIETALAAQRGAVSAIARAHQAAAEVSRRVRDATPARPVDAIEMTNDQMPTAIASPLPRRVFFGNIESRVVDDDPRIPEAAVMSATPRRTRGAGAEPVGAVLGEFQDESQPMATATAEMAPVIRGLRQDRDEAMQKMVEEQHKYTRAFGADARASLLEQVATSPRKFYAKQRLRKANREFNEKEKRFLDALKAQMRLSQAQMANAQARAVHRAQQEDRIFGRYYTTLLPGEDQDQAADRGRRQLYRNLPMVDANDRSANEIIRISEAQRRGLIPESLSSPRAQELRRIAEHPDSPGRGDFVHAQRRPIPWYDDPGDRRESTV